MGSPYLFRPASSGGGSASGASGINYLSAIYSGDTITNINQYDDGASSSPTNGTGGSPAGLTTALNTSTPLVGTSCVRFSKDAANRQGEGWSYDFTVDDISSDQSNPLWFQMYYRTSANYASSDVRGFLYDVTNGTLLNLNDISNGSGNIIAAPGDSQITWVGFTVTAATSYRLIWHIASTNASAWDLDFDCFVCSPQSVVPGAIQTLPESWTPTGSWVSNTTYTGRKWRIGGYGYYEVTVATTGAPTATQLLVNMPSGEVIDTAQLTNSTAFVAPLLGFGTINDGGSRIATAHVVFSTTSQVAPLYADASVASWGITATGPMTWANGDNVTFFFCAPIVGWAASAALSTTETLFSTAKARYTRSSAQTISVASATILDASTKTYDTLNSVTTGASWKFTAPRSGYYKAVCTVQYVARAYAAGNAALIQLFKNNSFVSQGAVTEAETTTSIIIATNHVDTIYLSKGDYIDFRAYNEGSVSTNTDGFQITVEEIPDFSIFSNYGTFELLTATSSTKTPSATGQYQALTSNSLTLTPGTWRLFGDSQFNSSGGSAGYTQVGVGFFGANGADSASTPTALNATTGLTVVSASAGFNGTLSPYLDKTSTGPITASPIIVRVTQSVTVYMVTYTVASTPANARITVYANAERLQ